mmetsp:Transcript_4242/g.9408  ORF Transcript_4242/g.9408 Transcript_4242/m.9408 type:complete len:95 (+) Transcript_4242:65-349(+)
MFKITRKISAFELGLCAGMVLIWPSLPKNEYYSPQCPCMLCIIFKRKLTLTTFYHVSRKKKSVQHLPIGYQTEETSTNPQHSLEGSVGNLTGLF